MTITIADFLHTVANEMTRCDAERLGAERYGAPRLSAFELLGTNENTLSDVIAELLSPRGSHGQGALFFFFLLRSVDQPEVGGGDTVQITREFRTKYQRRIDILIETPFSLIGIENKPFAAQGVNQLLDYHNDLVERAGRLTPCLIFLSDSDPVTAKEQVKIVRFFDWGESYPSLWSLLGDVRYEIKSGRTRDFVEDFRDWISRRFGGETMSDELEPYVSEIDKHFKRRDARKAIGAVLLSGEKIQKEVIDQVGSHIWGILQEHYSDLQGEDDELTGWIKEQYSPWRIWRTSWPKNCVFAIEAQRKGAAEICYGIRALKPATNEAAQNTGLVCNERHIFESSLQDVPNGSTSAWWPWYRKAPCSEWSQKFVAKLLIESDGNVEMHPEVMKMSDDALRLFEAIDNAVGSSK